MTKYPPQNERIAMGEIGQSGSGKKLAIVSYANGYYLSRRVQKRLEDEGVSTRVIDLRWLNPLPQEALVDAVRDCERVLIVDETRRTGGMSEALMAMLAEEVDVPLSRLAAEDSFIATGPAYGATLPSEESIYAAAKSALGGE